MGERVEPRRLQLVAPQAEGPEVGPRAEQLGEQAAPVEIPRGLSGHDQEVLGRHEELPAD